MHPSQNTVVKFNQTGGPEVLKLVNETLLPPAETEVLIRHEAIGVNFIDTYFRKGVYPTPMPASMGSEAAGVIEAVGSKVTDFKVGDRVVYATGPMGSYSHFRNLSQDFLVKIPDDISFEVAASVMLKGLTVQYLLTQTYQVSKDEIILFHAAAGGVGQIACQYARHLGAKLVGTVSSQAKADLALKLGAWKTLNYKTDDIAARMLELTDGKKVSVVYDSIGQNTWETSLNCLKPRGLMVSFGNASGPVTNVNLGILSQKGSLYVTRPTLSAYVSTPTELRAAAAKLFSLIGRGAISPEESKAFKLSEVTRAHEYLESTERTGSLILLPN